MTDAHTPRLRHFPTYDRLRMVRSSEVEGILSLVTFLFDTKATSVTKLQLKNGSRLQMMLLCIYAEILYRYYKPRTIQFFVLVVLLLPLPLPLPFPLLLLPVAVVVIVGPTLR
jgi:hypothetical protein